MLLLGVPARSVCRWRASPRTKRLWFRKGRWRIAGQAIDFNSTEGAVAFEDEYAGEVCFSPEHEVAEDAHTGRSFRPTSYLEVEARATALASPSRRLCGLELTEVPTCVWTTVLKHPSGEAKFIIGQRP